MIRITSYVPRLIVAAVAALLVSACGSSSPSSPSSVTNVPYSQTDLVVGTGATAAVGRSATVNYTGWLYSATATDNKGAQFDTSLQAGREPLSFVVGTGVITGFSQGVTGMRVGGKRRVIIPPSLGYGSQAAGGGTIPPNSTLVFDLELLAAS